MGTNLSPKIRLGHVITTPTDRYSSGLRTRMEAEVAQGLGFEVDIVTGWGPADRSLISAKINGINYFRLPSLQKYIYPHRDLAVLWQLYRLFRQRGYRIVQTHLAKAGILGRVAAGMARVPVIVGDVHGGPIFSAAHSWPRRWLYLALEKLAGRYTTHFIFYTSHLQEAYVAQGIGRQAAKRVIYPALGLSRFFEAPPLPAAERARLRSEWGLEEGHLVVGYFARMVPTKGQHLAIAAFARLKERYPQMRFLLVGGAIWLEEERYLQHLQDQVAQLGLEGRVIFTGHQAQVIPFYQMLDLFVMPSLYEGTANAMLEAVVTGLPVVAFDIPAVQELCSDAVIACPYGQVEGLAQGLEEGVMRVMAGSGRPSLALRKKLVETFSDAGWKKNLTDFYQELV